MSYKRMLALEFQLYLIFWLILIKKNKILNQKLHRYHKMKFLKTKY